VEFVVDKVAPGQIFSQYFDFASQFSFHRRLHIHHHHLSFGAGTIGQLVTDVSVSPHPKKLKKKKRKTARKKQADCLARLAFFFTLKMDAARSSET
jgi:hypothetical protein